MSAVVTTLGLGFGALLNLILIYKQTPFLYLFFYILLFYIGYKFLFGNIEKTSWVMTSVNIFTLIIRPDPLFSSGQNVYYPQILSNYSYGNIKNYWIAKIPEPYPAFSSLNKFFINYFGIQSINIILFIISTLFIFSIFLLISNKNNSSTNYSFITVITITLLLAIDSSPPNWINDSNILKVSIANLLGVSNMLLDGISAYSEFNSRRSLIPASFDILILLSIALFIKKHYKEGVLLGIIISLFHYYSFVNLAILIASLGLTRYLIKRKNTALVYSFIVVLAPLILYISTGIFENLEISKDINNSLDILYKRGSSEWMLLPVLSFGSFLRPSTVENPFYFEFDISTLSFIEPSHALTFASPTLGTFENLSVLPLEFLLICLFGFMCSNKIKSYFIANVIFLGSVITVTTWFFQSRYLLGALAIFHPWRFSGILTLLSSLMILSCLLSKIDKKILVSLKYLSLGLIFLAPLTNTLYNDIDPDQNFLDSKLKPYTALNSGTVIIPHDKETWILNSGGISAYSTRLFPYDLEYSDEWYSKYLLQIEIESSLSCSQLEKSIGKTGEEIVLIVTDKRQNIAKLEGQCSVEIIVYQ